MRLGQMLRMIGEPAEDWMVALEALLHKTVAKGNWARAMRSWSTDEILLARCPTRITGARTASGLVGCWSKVSKLLDLEQNEMTISGSTNTEVYLAIGEKQKWFSPEEARDMKTQLRKYRITTIGGWADWVNTDQSCRPLTRTDDAVVRTGEKIFHGMPTLDRIQKFGHSDGVCMRCQRAIESAEHLWWTCRKTKVKWRDYRYLTESLPCQLENATSLIEATDTAFKGMDLGKILPFVLILKTLRLERNAITYSHQQTRIPILIPLRNAYATARALLRKSEPASKTFKQLQKTCDALETVIARASGVCEDMADNSQIQSDDVQDETEREERESDTFSCSDNSSV
ncbi:hypothetical protein R1sor_000771 [Riccia sorocarpa]|uniref:Reverse transcriptase zinc-binding domain-containing protein n=1 Tax=Riccia sorocarpa TaxID=122646 RepID=A0ABD3GY18_9MARC